jgi:uncharacterized membrane protein (UPF0127 family)
VLVKYQGSNVELLEDYGLLVKNNKKKGNRVMLHESGRLLFENPRNIFAKVVKATAMWVDSDVKISCSIADTDEKKVAGLQDHPALGENEGLLFLYEPYMDVVFHQGTVPYSLDIIFTKDGSVIDIVSDTKVGSTEKWGCGECSAVLEVRGGFCKENNIKVGDRLFFNMDTDQNLSDYELEKELDKDAKDYLP